MVKFADLSNAERVQHIKDMVMLLLEDVSMNPDNLAGYMGIVKQAPIVPQLVVINENDDENTIKSKTELNESLIVNAKTGNEQIEREYLSKQELHNKTLQAVKSLAKKTGCICNGCLDFSLLNKTIPSEFQIFIDIARAECEKKIY